MAVFSDVAVLAYLKLEILYKNNVHRSGESLVQLEHEGNEQRCKKRQNHGTSYKIKGRHSIPSGELSGWVGQV